VFLIDNSGRSRVWEDSTEIEETWNGDDLTGGNMKKWRERRKTEYDGKKTSNLLSIRRKHRKFLEVHSYALRLNSNPLLQGPSLNTLSNNHSALSSFYPNHCPLLLVFSPCPRARMKFWTRNMNYQCGDTWLDELGDAAWVTKCLSLPHGKRISLRLDSST